MNRKKYFISSLLIITFLTSIIFSQLNLNAASMTKTQYPYGLSTLSTNSSDQETILKEWADWKSARITSSGAGGYLRVQCSGNVNNTTVSEGIGYGMLLCVYFNEKDIFDNLYKYCKKYFDANGLMNWQIDASGNVTASGKNCATDGDQDIAVSLVFAHKIWGSNGSINYQSEAKSMINSLYRNCVEATYILKPGDVWGGTDCVNPCYFTPAWYRIFSDFTGNQGWINVANKCYEIMDNISKYNNNTGLMPDWCKADGTPQTQVSYNNHYAYTYDACRCPWRIALDYSWYGNSKAKNYCETITKFFKNIGATNIVDGYTLTGSKIGQYTNPAFVSTAASGCMATSELSFGQQMFQQTLKVKDSAPYDYYGNTLRMLTLLYMSGNFPNLYSQSSTPTNSPIPTSTQTTTYGDANGDGKITSTDVSLVERHLLGISASNTAVIDVSGDGKVTSTDVSLIERYLLGTITKFPVQG